MARKTAAEKAAETRAANKIEQEAQERAAAELEASRNASPSDALPVAGTPTDVSGAAALPDTQTEEDTNASS
jgi:hypothetical protein